MNINVRIMNLVNRALAAYKQMQSFLTTPIDWKQRDKDENEMYAELRAIDQAAGPGLKVGRTLSFGVGDGGADYIITKIRKNDVVVEWVPLGDGYHSQAVGLSSDRRHYVVLRSTAEHQCQFVNNTPTFVPMSKLGV